MGASRLMFGSALGHIHLPLLKLRGGPKLRSKMHALADAKLSIVKRFVREAFDNIRGHATLREITEAVQSNRVDRVMETLGLAADAEKLVRANFKDVRAALRQLANDAGREATDQLEAALRPAIGMSFDLLNPNVVEQLQQYDFALIRGITETTREGIRGVIIRAFEEGGHPYDQAREIRDMIGLLPRQIDAVERYRDLLESEDRDSDQIDRMVGRYEERLLNDRARNIARTETIRASTEGRQAAWEQAVEEGLLDAGTLKQWIVTPDDRLAVVGSKTQVMTVSGWKAIAKIRPGELVLTHKDRFCRVFSINRRHYNGPIITIDVGGRGRHRVTVTHEHEILVHRGGADAWVFAKDLLDDDQFYINAAPCADCGALIPSSRAMPRTVCAPCALKRRQKQRWNSIEAREKRRRNKSGHSYLERKMAWFLGKQGIAFEAQKLFRFENAGKTRRAWADFFIPGRNIVIECDGPTHAVPPRAELDLIRDSAFAAQGVKVLRFSGRQIRAEFAAVASEIRQHCCLMRVKARRITRRSTNHQPCYDLQVEGDESFVAGGIVVHNCPICEALGEKYSDGIPINDEFESEDGSFDGPPAHPSCRCTTSLIINRE